jgi:hypothetical protein
MNSITHAKLSSTVDTTPAWIRFGRSLREIYRYVVLDSFHIVRHQGWRELLRRRGWKFFAVVLAYYLVRDTILYILIPIALARGLM